MDADTVLYIESQKLDATGLYINTPDGNPLLLTNSGPHSTVRVINGAGTGIYVSSFTSDSPAIFTSSRDGRGISSTSVNNYGVLGISTNSVGGAFSSNSNEPDLLLLGSSSGDNGIIASDPNRPSSDFIVRSYDDVSIQLDRDDSETGVFNVVNSQGNALISTSENNFVKVRSSIEFLTDGSDVNGYVKSAQGSSQSNLIFQSNKDVEIHLDNDGPNTSFGHLRILDSDYEIVMSVSEFGHVKMGSNLELKTQFSGTIQSDRSFPSSDLFLDSNDDIVFLLDGNNNDDGEFRIRDNNFNIKFKVVENGDVDMGGILEMIPASGDNGRIQSDQSQPSSDLIIDSNDDIVLLLDNNGGDDGQLRVENGSNTIIFRLFENGNLNIGGTLFQGSDINRKYDIRDIHPAEFLTQLKELPIYKWKYKEESIDHVGPMAQDFYKAFGLGVDETTISSIDADGVIMAALKALAEENDNLKKEIKELRELVLDERRQ